MASSFHSLYLPCAEREPLLRHVQQTLVQHGYTLFDPFSIMPGKAYAQSVRLFAAPLRAGWLRLLGENVDAALLADFAADGLCLSLALAGDVAEIVVYHNGAARHTPEALADALSPHTRAPYTRADVLAALTGNAAEKTTAGALPLDALPDDLQRLAGSVDPKAANNLFGRLSKQLMQKAGGDKDAAAALLARGADWQSAGGARIRRLMRCLDVPEDWQTPDFVTLRDAYQLHLRRQRLPGARLYPGDAETLARVADALAYTPLYGGR